MEYGKVILASLLSALILFIIAKMIGHKQVSQLELFDYITGITLGSIGAELATTLDQPWWKPVIAMIVFGAVTVALSFLTRKFPRSRKYINGTPTIIMSNGKILRQNMKKAKLELSEFMMLCRQEGYFHLSDIAVAVYETNGKLTILPVSTKRPLQPEDISMVPSAEGIDTELIMDGRILGENLKRAGLDEIWLKKQLSQQGIGSPKDVFLAQCDTNHHLTIYRTT